MRVQLNMNFLTPTKFTHTLAGLTLLILTFSSSAQNRDSRAEFEVATFRLVKLESREVPKPVFRRVPGRISYRNISLATLIMRAYNLPNYRIEWPKRLNDTKYGGPYSIEATFPESTTDAGLRGMLQRLLEDRLALRTHWVNRVLPVYEVKIAPGGAKVRPSDKFDPAGIPDDGEAYNYNRILQDRSGWRITGIMSIAQVLGTLGGDLGQPMIDKTGLPGYYDIDFVWNRPNSGPPAPRGQSPATAEASTPEGSKTATLFPALEKQLGLRAEASKLGVDVLTIDAVEHTPKGD